MTYVKGLKRAETPEETIERLTMPLATSECWAWLGFHHAGYAMMTYGYKPRKQTHVTRFLMNAPKGMEVDHLCHNPWCVNPDHLEVVTHLENVRRHGEWIRDNRTVCEIHGTSLREYGGLRICRECRNEYQNKRRDHKFPHQGQRKFKCDDCGSPYEVLATPKDRGPRYGCRKCHLEDKRKRHHERYKFNSVRKYKAENIEKIRSYQKEYDKLRRNENGSKPLV